MFSEGNPTKDKIKSDILKSDTFSSIFAKVNEEDTAS